MRMVFEYEDGTKFVTTDKSEEACVCNAMDYEGEHGNIVYYSEIEKGSFLYENDGIQ